MHFSKLLNTFLCSLILAVFPQTSFGADPLAHHCSRSENFTAQSYYAVNLKTVMTLLTYKTPKTGFGIVSVGQPQGQPAYGLALCRGDVSTSECKTCVSDATTEIRNRCPYNKGAIIWYDYCLFKYLYTNFTGNIDKTVKLHMCNRKNASDPTSFNSKTREFLSQLAQKAYVNPNFYATGEQKLENSDTLYGLTQCTRDLSSSDCKKCLDDAINDLPNCCNGKQGGRALDGSCSVRYEIYPFVKE